MQRVRRFLDRLYWLSGVLAGLFMFLIFAVIIAQVGLNAIDRIAGLAFGGAIGLSIPSYSDFAGFFLAASSFLGLASTLRHGALIRVSLVIERLPEAARRPVEIWCCAIGAAISGYATYHSVLVLLDAREYGELSTGIIAIPMWIPQLSLVAGLAVLSIAFIDELAAVLRGDDPAYRAETGELG